MSIILSKNKSSISLNINALFLVLFQCDANMESWNNQAFKNKEINSENDNPSTDYSPLNLNDCVLHFVAWMMRCIVTSFIIL